MQQEAIIVSKLTLPGLWAHHGLTLQSPYHRGSRLISEPKKGWYRLLDAVDGLLLLTIDGRLIVEKGLVVILRHHRHREAVVTLAKLGHDMSYAVWGIWCCDTRDWRQWARTASPWNQYSRCKAHSCVGRRSKSDKRSTKGRLRCWYEAGQEGKEDEGDKV